MRNPIFFLAIFAFISCKESGLKMKITPEIRKKNNGLVGMRYGGDLKEDSSLYMGTYSYSKTLGGHEFGFGFWRVCTTGEVFDKCTKIIDVATLDTQLNDQTMHIIVESITPPKDSLVGTSCQDFQNREILGWIDQTDPDRRRVNSALRVSDSLLKFIPVPPESVTCDFEENANEGEEKN